MRAACAPRRRFAANGPMSSALFIYCALPPAAAHASLPHIKGVYPCEPNPRHVQSAVSLRSRMGCAIIACASDSLLREWASPEDRMDSPVSDRKRKTLRTYSDPVPREPAGARSQSPIPSGTARAELVCGLSLTFASAACVSHAQGSRCARRHSSPRPSAPLPSHTVRTAARLPTPHKVAPRRLTVCTSRDRCCAARSLNSEFFFLDALLADAAVVPVAARRPGAGRRRSSKAAVAAPQGGG